MHQRAGGRPNPNAEIKFGLPGHIDRGADQLQGHGFDGILQGDEDQPDQHRQAESTGQNGTDFHTVFASVGLGHRPGGALAQKTEGPEHKGENQTADGNRRQIMGRGQMSDNRRIDDPDQRNGDV